MQRNYKTFVSLGNAKQHFTRLLRSVQLNIELLPQPVLIQRGHTPFESDKCDIIDFINMDKFIEYVAQAEILILHAGAGSVLHTVRACKRPIVMPRRGDYGEHVNDHQHSFAKTLHLAGKVLMVENDKELSNAIQVTRENGSTIQFNATAPNAIDIIRHKIEKILRK